MGDYLLRFKVEIVKQGLLEASITKIEKYIREIISKFDTENTG